MKDFSTVFYVLATLISGLVGAYLSNKKTDQSNLDDDNTRLSKRNKVLTDTVEKKDEQIDDLHEKLLHEEEKNSRLRIEIDTLKKGAGKR